MVVIEDEIHAEIHGTFPDVPAALAELRRRADIPWDVAPNRAPCASWKTCGRAYEIVEYDDSQSPWQERRRYAVLAISHAGVRWSADVGCDLQLM